MSSRMHELAAQGEISIEQQVRSVERELKFRYAVYPRFVRSGKMSGAQKDYEIKCMHAVLETLRRLLPPPAPPAQAALLPQDEPSS